MTTKRNILQLKDIKLLVDSFYGKVREAEHLEKMYRFWQTILLGTHTYFGSPFAPHASLPVDMNHFNRWLELFNETIDDHFCGEKAEEARWRAGKMAEMFLHKIEYYRTNHTSPLS